MQVYDYADLHVPMLARMFNRRGRCYEALGYQVLLQGSAVPGWPVEVPLPLDPLWKSDYAATVKRLIRDGVDVPSATLFSSISTNGSEGARSATEAFLFRRLEALPQTSGRFLLNASLPIPFDGLGKMEVDLLCLDARFVVELDGPQHLADPTAYRRDRRKDALLQENGYTVLRLFLLRMWASSLAMFWIRFCGSSLVVNGSPVEQIPYLKPV